MRDMPVTQLDPEQSTEQAEWRKAFGQIVRGKRNRLGLSQEELAEAAHCDRQTINRLENGRHAAPFERICWLAAALQCEPGELFPPTLRPRQTQPTSLPRREPGQHRRPA
jgi:transcriptional regulator with XRE-family HTH domain